jgi:transcriptional antiterminator RfaH
VSKRDRRIDSPSPLSYKTRCMKQWYVVQTNPREDSIAMSALKQMGIDVYQPFMQKYVFHARKKTLKRYPLFPNYLFVNLSSSEENLHKVRWCRGIRRILLDNYMPIPIDKDFIEGLKTMEDKEDGVIRKPMDFKAGDLVRVKAGPMKDILGVFESWDSDEGRVKILIEMVSNKAKVVLHSSLLEKA